jgi:hypothetical protein
MWSLDHIFLGFLSKFVMHPPVFFAKNSKKMIICGQQLSSNHVECVQIFAG